MRERLRAVDAPPAMARLRASASLRRRSAYSNVYAEVVTERRRRGGRRQLDAEATRAATPARILEVTLGVTLVMLAVLSAGGDRRPCSRGRS